MARVTVNESVCKGCGLCVSFCPKGVLALHPTKINAKGHTPAYAAKPELCTGCASCARMCPDVALTVER